MPNKKTQGKIDKNHQKALEILLLRKSKHRPIIGEESKELAELCESGGRYSYDSPIILAATAATLARYKNRIIDQNIETDNGYGQLELVADQVVADLKRAISENYGGLKAIKNLPLVIDNWLLSPDKEVVYYVFDKSKKYFLRKEQGD